MNSFDVVIQIIVGMFSGVFSVSGYTVIDDKTLVFAREHRGMGNSATSRKNIIQDRGGGKCLDKALCYPVF